jgi:hypothetical protein
MINATHTPEAPWRIVHADDQRRTRLNLIRHLLDSVPYKKVGMDLPKIPRDISIAPSRAGSLIPLKAASCRPQVLYLLVNRFSFLLKPCDLRFWHIGAAQLIEHLADGEFVYFSHGKILFA